MKQFRSGLLSFLCLFLLVACGKDDDTTQPKPGVKQYSGTMKATINGAPWVAQEALIAKAMPHGILISGHSNGKAVSITISEIIKAGKFDANTYESVSGWYMENLNGVQHSWASITSKECKLEITKLDWSTRKMSGTFAFVADSQASSFPTGRYNVTSGEFTDVNIDAAVPAPAATMQMSTQVDNVPWSASAVVLYGFPGYYYLNASDANGHAINIIGFSSLQPGSFNADFGSYSVPTINDHLYWLSDQQNPPVVTISSYDPLTKKASGTFSFTATALPMLGGTGTKTISQGSFTDIPLY